jgi:hypothetical protein
MSVRADPRARVVHSPVGKDDDDLDALERFGVELWSLAQVPDGEPSSGARRLKARKRMLAAGAASRTRRVAG